MKPLLVPRHDVDLVAAAATGNFAEFVGRFCFVSIGPDNVHTARNVAFNNKTITRLEASFITNLKKYRER